MSDPISIKVAGLGNEILPWAKAYLAANALNHRLSRPAWAFARGSTLRDFGWSRAALLPANASLLRPRGFRITEQMYRSTGKTDYGEAVAVLREQGVIPVGTRVLIHEGMWGGYPAIDRARPFIWSELLRAPGVLSRLTQDGGSSRVLVGVHIRGGDFTIRAVKPGLFNVALPHSWFDHILKRLRQRYALDSLEIRIFSDEPDSRDVQVLADRYECHVSKGTAAQDLASMATSDIIVPSISSFSMAAIWLSHATYFWHRGQVSAAGLDSVGLWASEPSEQGPRSLTRQNALWTGPPIGRAHLWRGDEENLPHAFLTQMELFLQMKRRQRDLIYYGVIPVSSDSPVQTA